MRVTLTKRNYCLDLTLFPTAGFASILAPQSVRATTTHMATFLNYWGLWVEVEDKEAEQERVVESLRNHISLPPKYQLFSQEKRFCCGNVTIKSLKVQLLPNSRLLGSSCQDYNRAHLSRIVSGFLLALHFLIAT